jgi:hypothetical protein
MKRGSSEDLFLFCGVPTSLLIEGQGVRMIVKPSVHVPPGLPNEDWDVVLRLVGRVPQIDADVVAVRVRGAAGVPCTVTLYTPRYKIVVVREKSTARWHVEAVRIYDTL